MRVRRSFMCLALIGLVAVCAGCNSSRSGNRPETVPIAVVVTKNGAPVDGATVAFIADGGSNSSSGITSTEGIASMGTFGDGDGVVPGKYKVTVRKVTTTTMGAGNPNAKVESPDSDIFPGTTVQKDELPTKYADVKTSGLVTEVTKDGPSEIKFDLGS